MNTCYNYTKYNRIRVFSYPYFPVQGQSVILSLYRKIWVRENPFCSIIYTVYVVRWTQRIAKYYILKQMENDGKEEQKRLELDLSAEDDAIDRKHWTNLSLTFLCITLKNDQTLITLRCSHEKISKVCQTIFQLYA